MVLLSERKLTPRIPTPGFYGTRAFGIRKKASDFTQRLPLSVFYNVGYLYRGWTVVHFCRNQLSRDLIGLLPLNAGQRN